MMISAAIKVLTVVERRQTSRAIRKAVRENKMITSTRDPKTGEVEYFIVVN